MKLNQNSKTMAASLNITSYYHFSPSKTSQNCFPKSSILSFQTPFHHQLKFTKYRSNRLFVLQPKATLEEDSSVLVQEQNPAETNELLREVEESVKVLKKAAKTRKVKKDEVLAALAIIKKSKLDPSGFIDSLGGTGSPGRTWMLVFTAKKQLKSGTYLPITAVQRFDAAARRIENGVYFGPIGCLSFEGRFSWKKRILAFVFETLKIKIGPFDPLQISVGKKEDREPSNNDPFFIWFYVDEEIAVAQGKSGGTAFWCRCRRVT